MSAESSTQSPPQWPWSALLVGAFALGALSWFVGMVPVTRSGGALGWAWLWVETLGVSFAIRVDGLSMIFGLLISGFGALIALYAARYLQGHPHFHRFFLYFGLFMASMLGLILADDLIALFVFWEMTTLASFLLVGFNHATPKARRNAWQALLITGAGGLALLAGLVLLGQAAGTTRISEIAALGGLTEHPHYPLIVTLVLLGAFTKSAQFPFHIWLPGAMAAPTPVSAYLHSATMVKAGVYLLCRLHPSLAGTDLWFWTLSVTGGATMLLAAMLAAKQTDLKMMLAYTSVMALGSLVMFLGADTSVALAAALTFIIVHALYKAALFLGTGAIEYATGTREIARLGGLWRKMPVTSAAMVLAACSMAGFPPFLGFIGKELKYEGALAIAEEPIALATAAVLANALMVTLGLVIVLRVVFGSRGDSPHAPHEAPWAMLVGPVVFAGAGLAIGLSPGSIGTTLVQPALLAVYGAPYEVKLKLWHGVNLPLMMSILTSVLGLTLYLGRRYLMALAGRIPAYGDAFWDGLMVAVPRGFAWATRQIQTGSLRDYLTVTFLAVTLPPLIWLLATDALALPRIGFEQPMAIVAAALAAVGAVAAGMAAQRQTMIAGIGLVGTGLALLFVLFGAPDVAITQLLVDILLILLILGVMRHLPDLPRPGQEARRNLVVAGIAGISISALTLAVTATPFSDAVAAAMTAMAVPEAKGHNIVNVILVDFRALDTFGEIAVVATAAIGALSLLRLARRTRKV